MGREGEREKENGREISQAFRTFFQKGGLPSPS